MNEQIVEELVVALNESLKKHKIRYNENLHDMIIEKFEDIAEEEYRRYLGK